MADAGQLEDAVAKCQRILALVDTYRERPDWGNRSALRHALMAEFQTQRLSPRDAEHCLPVSGLTKRPQVWYTKAEALQAIRNAEDAHGIG